jgi:hypothetical protein
VATILSLLSAPRLPAGSPPRARWLDRQPKGSLEAVVDSGQGEGRPRFLRLKRLGLVTGSALISINVWTGAPLFAVWVGSQVQQSSTNLSMTAVFSVVVVLAALVFTLAWLLTWINASYDELTGRPAAAKRTSPWLRSMRGERETDVRRRYGVSVIEKILVVTVVAAVIAFEIWFFFFAGSSLPRQ